MAVNRGEVWFADLSPIRGIEQSGDLPDARMQEIAEALRTILEL
jgi:mRNA-degrading endonuclease toxin of MazEF toxin-antitoxin module